MAISPERIQEMMDSRSSWLTEYFCLSMTYELNLCLSNIGRQQYHWLNSIFLKSYRVHKSLQATRAYGLKYHKADEQAPIIGWEGIKGQLLIL
jgi:hypothetical protein